MSSKDTKPNEHLLAVVCFVVALGLASCEIFSVRPSEEPTGGATRFALPQSPDIVISNMVNAISARDVVIYGDIFTEDFVFVPDPEDVLELENYYPGVFSDWDIEIERDVAQHMLDPSRVSYASLRFDEDEESVIEDTDSTYVVQEQYRFLIWMESLDTYAGSARFSMRRLPDGLWYIYDWQDSRPEAGGDDGAGTWGMLKGKIRGTT